jgi:hypothetical protein
MATKELAALCKGQLANFESIAPPDAALRRSQAIGLHPQRAKAEQMVKHYAPKDRGIQRPPWPRAAFPGQNQGGKTQGAARRRGPFGAIGCRPLVFAGEAARIEMVNYFVNQWPGLVTFFFT